MKKLCTDNNKIYGVLARGMPQEINTTSTNIGMLKGKYGESVIGSMFNILALEDLDFYVFHSCAIPKNMRGETDHIILYKNKIILVETKTYSAFTSIKVNKAGELRGRPKKDKNVYRKLDSNNLIEKVKLYEKLFPEYAVHAVTVVTRSGVKTTSENGKYKVASLDNFLSSLEYHKEQATEVTELLHQETLHYLALHCLNNDNQKYVE